MSDEPGQRGADPFGLGPAVHAVEASHLLDKLSTSPADGLSSEEVEARLDRCGLNKLPEQEKDPAWKRFLAQFKDPLVLTSSARR